MNMDFRAALLQVLDSMWVLTKKGTEYEYEIYADYRDEMSDKTACEILRSSDPEQAFWERMDEWYLGYEGELRSELIKEVEDKLTEEGAPYYDGLPEDVDLWDELLDLVYFTLPYDHYLKQSFQVNIMMDTGDGNYDFTLNSPYPCWYGGYDNRLDEKSSLLWLARQQGYNKTQLWKALREGDMRDPKGFLQSCRVEVANLPSHMATMTFLVEMTLGQLIELNRLVQLQDRNGHFYDATKNPYCGYIVLSKDTMCGLFDPWQGGGSVLEIELEKDVKLPIKYIFSAMPDGGNCYGYGVGNVYGLCGSAWRQGGVKAIHAPSKKTLEKERVA